MITPSVHSKRFTAHSWLRPEKSARLEGDRLDPFADEAQCDLALDELQRRLAEEIAPPAGEGGYLGLLAFGGNLVEVFTVGDDLWGDTMLSAVSFSRTFSSSAAAAVPSGACW